MTTKKIRVGILGASGYTGADLIRLGCRHPNMEIVFATADRKAGKELAEVFPHLGRLSVPTLISIDDINWANAGVDAIFCALPHATSQRVVKDIMAAGAKIKVIDLSADFRLRDLETYATWYGKAHDAAELQKTAVYGLTEIYRDEVKTADLVACPGCYPTAALLSLMPLLQAKLIKTEDIIIDAKSGISGAGRSAKESNLFTEIAEGMHAYGIAAHRHSPEIEQELGVAAGESLIVNFTPHLVPMNRGEYETIYVKLADGKTADDLRAELSRRYADEPFIHVMDAGIVPQSRFVRGSNDCMIGVFEDRIPGRAMIIATIDNLVKGSSGQAIQNFNLMFGLPEVTGLEQAPMFP